VESDNICGSAKQLARAAQSSWKTAAQSSWQDRITGKAAGHAAQQDKSCDTLALTRRACKK
jgi:hypothetical protein